MKKQMMKAPVTGLLMVLFALSVQGCSQSTQDSVKELGNDMQRDVNKAARNVDDAVKDAVD